MDFEKTPREEREAREYLSHRSFVKFAASTAVIVLVLLSRLFSNGTETEPPDPSESANALPVSVSTVEGRKNDIALSYPATKIVAESERGGGVISVLETEDRHSFAIYGPAENPAPGYEWTCYYYGAFFPKKDMVRGTIALPGVAEQYEVYLLGDTEYDALEITRKDDDRIQREIIYFDDAGIAVLQLDTAIDDPHPRVIAYDTEGNPAVFTGGE